MKIPTVFILDNKNLDRKIKDVLQDEESRKTRQIDSAILEQYPEKLGDYTLRTDFEMLNKKDWEWHFGKRIPKYIIGAGEIQYKIPSAITFMSIYILEFKSGTDLNKVNRKINLEKEINQLGEIMVTKCLKKDNYLVAIKVNKADMSGLDVFENWYLNNLGLETL